MRIEARDDAPERYCDLLTRSEAGDDVALLTALQERLSQEARHWERHMNRYHPPYRRGVINLTGPWWDCLPSSAPYGDGLLDEVSRRLAALLDQQKEQG